MWAKRKKTGFTIVELLIVIVVIGILAAITIVAYNGIQTRAENTKTINGVSAYAKIFAMYAAEKGDYPSTASYPCLGEPTGGACAKIVTGTTSCNYSGITYTQTAFNDLLTPYMGSSKPSISDQRMDCTGGDVYRGAYVNANSTNTKTLTIIYHLKGDQMCQALGGAILQYKQQTGETTRCAIAMPTL